MKHVPRRNGMARATAIDLSSVLGRIGNVPSDDGSND
jgi:hypothetical protein